VGFGFVLPHAAGGLFVLVDVAFPPRAYAGWCLLVLVRPPSSGPFGQTLGQTSGRPRRTSAPGAWGSAEADRRL